jgi:CheY-like chemotaxis protein
VTPPPTSSLRVLLAEDNPMNAKVARAVLGRCGIVAPDLAVDGAQAVAAAATTRYDIILMDMRMPRMNGPDAVRAIRAHEAANSLPPAWIVACTANAALEDRQECHDAGMDFFMEKPVHPDAMRTLLRRHAEHVEAAEAAEAADATSAVAD